MLLLAGISTFRPENRSNRTDSHTDLHDAISYSGLGTGVKTGQWSFHSTAVQQNKERAIAKAQ